MSALSPEGQNNFQGDTLSGNPDSPFDGATDLSVPEVGIFGENSHTENEIEDKTYGESLPHISLKSELRALDAWLSWKVKNELITQIVSRGGVDGEQINVSSIKSALCNEIDGEKDKHTQSGEYIDRTVIPGAAARLKPRVDVAGVYWAKDVSNLQSRSEIHFEIADRLDAIASTGDDGLYDLTEKYIQRTMPEASRDALTIVLQQRQELEAVKRRDEAKISELEGLIDILGVQLQEAQAKIADRDLQMHDQELTLHMLTDAKKIAV